MTTWVVTIFFLFIKNDPAFAQGQCLIPIQETINRLIKEEDTDNDKKITIADPVAPSAPLRRASGTESGPEALAALQMGYGDKKFIVMGKNKCRHLIEGTYPLAVLLQEFKLAADSGKTEFAFNETIVKENPVDRTSRLIRELFWDGLTRRVDEEGLARIVVDEKTTVLGGFNYVYVPFDDAEALDYFQSAARLRPKLRLEIRALPERINNQFLNGLEGKHGILTLKLYRDGEDARRGAPFVVPGGRFNEMYGWDSYFIVLGLLEDGRLDLAKAMVDNHVYQIKHYGKILNANRTYYLTRSQPPFLTSMALAVYAKLPKTADNKIWLAEALGAAVKEYEDHWTKELRLVKETGLSRYFDDGAGPCPEVEAGHYDSIVLPYAKQMNLSSKDYLEGYKAGRIKNSDLDVFFIHDRAVRESGHDTTYRFDGRTADFVSVDLNSLLFKIETDMASAIDGVFRGRLVLSDGRHLESALWRQRAGQRKKKIKEFLWDEKEGLFFDYDFKNRRRSGYVSATAFYPLWAGLANMAQAQKVAKAALSHLECLSGLAATTEKSRGPITADRPQRQWDWPYGWAPHQMLAWRGLVTYGFRKDAERLAYRWLYTIAKNARDYNQTITEKYDVVKGSHEVFAEYGNVGTKFSYITKEGFGWTNASYQVGLKILSPDKLQALKELKNPAEVF
ncbi:MAG: trehalase [Elusimicrobia bacterium]|nr:trehalase [Elusimicrobiota bacterium]